MTPFPSRQDSPAAHPDLSPNSQIVIPAVTPTLVLPAAATRTKGDIRNMGTGIAWVGMDATVTAGNGFPLDAGAGAPFGDGYTAVTTGEVWVFSTPGTVIAVLDSRDD